MLCKLWMGRKAFLIEFSRCKALLAKQECDWLTPEDRTVLGSISCGERSENDLGPDHRVRNAMEQFKDKAWKEIRRQVLRRFGLGYFEALAWEVTIDALRNAPGRWNVNPGYLDSFLPDYCEAVLDGKPPPDEELAQDLQELDQAGFTEKLLRILRDKCPGESEALGLPTTTGNRASASEGGWKDTPTQQANESQASTEGLPAQSKRRTTADWLGKALITIRDHPEWSDNRIAKEVDVSHTTLIRSKEYQRAAGIARDGGNPPKGYKNAETSEMDTWTA